MKKFLIFLMIVIALIIVLGIALPSEYTVDQSIVINAKPEQIHGYVGELEKWPEWTPFEKEDPTVKVTRGDKTSGVGASQTWTSDGGNGELTFTKSDPKTGIAYDFAFIDGEKRMPAKSTMTYTPEGEGTRVNWTMSGNIDMPIAGPYMAMLMNPMMVGPMFKRGLTDLKATCEGTAKPE